MHVWARDDFGELIFQDEHAFENIMLGSMVEPSVLDEALWHRAKAYENLTLKYEISLAAHGMTLMRCLTVCAYAIKLTIKPRW